MASICSPQLASAQGLSLFSGGSDPLDGTLAEREKVLETLDTSFVREQLSRLDEARRDAADGVAPFDAAELVEDIRRAYLEGASRKLFELEGDGSLTLGEVASALPAIRERYLNRFENVVEARSAGYPPPPLREEFDDVAAFVAAQARYTLATRNPPPAWGKLALAAGAGVLLALALSRLLRAFSRGISYREHRVLGSALDSVRVPLILAAMAGGLLYGLRFLWLPAAVEDVASTTLVIAIVALAFLACWNLCDEIADIVGRAVQRATGKDSIEHARRLVERALRVLVIVLFLAVVARFVFGVGLTAMLAGLGVVGVGLWILTRGLVENVAASFTLFGDRVFRIGDIIVHKGEWGTIEDIGFRSTRCRTFDGHMLHIPNRNLVDDTVWNVSARPYLRSRFRLSLVYDTPPEKVEEAMEIAHAVIDGHGDEVNRDEGVNVVFDIFGDYDLQLLVQYYTASDDYWTAKGTMSRINREILRRFDEAGIAFAFPTQRTLLESDEETALAARVEGVVAVRGEGSTSEKHPAGGDSDVDDAVDGPASGGGAAPTDSGGTAFAAGRRRAGCRHGSEEDEAHGDGDEGDGDGR